MDEMAGQQWTIVHQNMIQLNMGPVLGAQLVWTHVTQDARRTLGGRTFVDAPRFLQPIHEVQWAFHL